METTSTLGVVVESGGNQVVGHVGLHALGAFADRLSLGQHLLGASPFRVKEPLSTTGARSLSTAR